MSEKKEERTVELGIEELEERIAPGVLVIHGNRFDELGDPIETGGGNHGDPHVTVFKPIVGKANIGLFK